MVQLVIMILSIAFIYSTGLVYQLFARPAWKSKIVGVNFFLSTLTIGSIGTYVLAALNRLENIHSLLYICILTEIMIILGQIYYSAYVSKLEYGVALNIFSREFNKPYIGWIITGVILPLVIIFYATFFGGSSTITAIILLVSALMGLIFWQAFFFLAGKHIKFFPQYDMDLKTIF